ncbi:mitochondrial DIL domain-containing protein [Andalucia godoyi]|uniref:Mitochondrial DIL domain-containing protein n=1 Tax=Andalucia godoyi TaxID=505711 RepID=A0A8K0AHP2_ANDGO|nr:mitochondrial DIL domain-containing protein [Andalucia godoyi]|eukprot:ANDGO_05410.mRNA.1 mitochondrial DIL domain-containing protein
MGILKKTGGRRCLFDVSVSLHNLMHLPRQFRGQSFRIVWKCGSKQRGACVTGPASQSDAILLDYSVQFATHLVSKKSSPMSSKRSLSSLSVSVSSTSISSVSSSKSNGSTGSPVSTASRPTAETMLQPLPLGVVECRSKLLKFKIYKADDASKKLAKGSFDLASMATVLQKEVSETQVIPVVFAADQEIAHLKFSVTCSWDRSSDAAGNDDGILSNPEKSGLNEGNVRKGTTDDSDDAENDGDGDGDGGHHVNATRSGMKMMVFGVDGEKQDRRKSAKMMECTPGRNTIVSPEVYRRSMEANSTEPASFQSRLRRSFVDSPFRDKSNRTDDDDDDDDDDNDVASFSEFSGKLVSPTMSAVVGAPGDERMHLRRKSNLEEMNAEDAGLSTTVQDEVKHNVELRRRLRSEDERLLLDFCVFCAYPEYSNGVPVAASILFRAIEAYDVAPALKTSRHDAGHSRSRSASGGIFATMEAVSAKMPPEAFAFRALSAIKLALRQNAVSDGILQTYYLSTLCHLWNIYAVEKGPTAIFSTAFLSEDLVSPGTRVRSASSDRAFWLPDLMSTTAMVFEKLLCLCIEDLRPFILSAMVQDAALFYSGSYIKLCIRRSSVTDAPSSPTPPSAFRSLMTALELYLTELDDAFVPDAVCEQFIRDIVHWIDAHCFNAILRESSLIRLNMATALQLKMSIGKISEFFHSRFPRTVSVDSLFLMLRQLSDVCVMEKNGLLSAEVRSTCAGKLNRSQLVAILQKYEEDELDHHQVRIDLVRKISAEMVAEDLRHVPRDSTVTHPDPPPILIDERKPVVLNFVQNSKSNHFIAYPGPRKQQFRLHLWRSIPLPPSLRNDARFPFLQH